jgi:hypothetical protein
MTKIVSHEVQLREIVPTPIETASLNEKISSTGDVSSHPDIYFIVVDGYARSDILNEIYGMTNESFLQFLTNQGFYIANQSRSNYAQSIFSMASTLNMDYLDRIAAGIEIESQNVIPITRHFRYSFVRQILETVEYEVIAFSSGYRRTEIEDADIYLSPPSKGITTLETMILQTTGAVLILDLGPSLGLRISFPGYQRHRDRILYTFDKLPELAKERSENPRFIFAHILAPHPPFVFNSDGSEVTQHTHYGLEDGGYFPGTKEDYIQGYRNQLIYINSLLTSSIKDILEFSESPPVILLQADHGPASRVDWWSSPDEKVLMERMSILNAYYLPDIEETYLFDSISPVNSFRVVFNHYFGSEFPLLPDKSYYSSVRQPYDFILVPPEADLGEPSD